MQISRFTSSKPSKFAFASYEKSIRRPTASFVRCCLRNRRTRGNDTQCAVVIQNRNTKAKDTARCCHSSLQTGAYGWMIPACAGFFMACPLIVYIGMAKTRRDQWLFSRMRNTITRLIRSARNGAALVADESDICLPICCLCIHSCFSSCERMARSSIMRLICPFSRTRKRAA